MTNQETNIKIISEKRILDVPHTPVDQVTFTNWNYIEHKYNIVRRKKAICILFETDDRFIWTIIQFRHAVGQILDECVAGQIEIWENPITCAQKELLEEAWYAVDAKDLQVITNIYTSSGFTDEELILMIGQNAKFVGREDSHEASEDINLVKRSRDEFVKWYKDGVNANSIRESKFDIIIMRWAVQWNKLCKELLSMIMI